MFAVMADGHEVTTVEGLGLPSELHPIQEGFREEHGLQCGYCTPGMMMASKALLDENPNPTEEDIRWGLSRRKCGPKQARLVADRLKSTTKGDVTWRRR
jgi:carbon-monoxide dehydrogenase small subunit